MRFESAGRIKLYVDSLGTFAKGPFRFVRPLDDFRFIALQRGGRPGTAKVFLIRRGIPGTDRSCLLADKRYRSADHRMFHRDADYLEGRRTRASRRVFPARCCCR